MAPSRKNASTPSSLSAPITSNDKFPKCSHYVLAVGNVVLAPFDGEAFLQRGRITEVQDKHGGLPRYEVQAEIAGTNSPQYAGVKQTFAIESLRQVPTFHQHPVDQSGDQKLSISTCQIICGNYVHAKSAKGRQAYLPAMVVMNLDPDSQKYEVEFLHDQSKAHVRRADMLLMVQGCPMVLDHGRNPVYVSTKLWPSSDLGATSVSQVKDANKQQQTFKNANKQQPSKKAGMSAYAAPAQLSRIAREFLKAEELVTELRCDPFHVEGDWNEAQQKHFSFLNLTIPVVCKLCRTYREGILDMVNMNKNMLANFVVNDGPKLKTKPSDKKECRFKRGKGKPKVEEKNLKVFLFTSENTAKVHFAISSIEWTAILQVTKVDGKVYEFATKTKDSKDALLEMARHMNSKMRASGGHGSMTNAGNGAQTDAVVKGTKRKFSLVVESSKVEEDHGDDEEDPLKDLEDLEKLLD